MGSIKDNVQRILQELPAGVQLVVAGKGRSAAELMEAVEGGARIIGENYVQEAADACHLLGNIVQWHFLGHLQKNKVKRAVEIFDMLETVDSMEIATEIEKRCTQNRVMPVLLEVNSGREVKKSGVWPESALRLAQQISGLSHLRLMGLMTMGPPVSYTADSRPFFAITRRVFEEIKKLDLPGVEMKYLSMGMTDSYRVALEEGANLVRIGKGIFGEH